MRQSRPLGPLPLSWILVRRVRGGWWVRNIRPITLVSRLEDMPSRCPKCAPVQQSWCPNLVPRSTVPCIHEPVVPLVLAPVTTTIHWEIAMLPIHWYELNDVKVKQRHLADQLGYYCHSQVIPATNKNTSKTSWR